MVAKPNQFTIIATWPAANASPSLNGIKLLTVGMDGALSRRIFDKNQRIGSRCSLKADCCRRSRRARLRASRVAAGNRRPNYVHRETRRTLCHSIPAPAYAEIARPDENRPKSWWSQRLVELPLIGALSCGVVKDVRAVDKAFRSIVIWGAEHSFA